MLVNSELSGLRDGARELVLVSQLSDKYDELLVRIVQLLDITLPLPNTNVHGEARVEFDRINPCGGADPLLAELLDCDDSHEAVRGRSYCSSSPYFVVHGLVLRGGGLDIKYCIFDLWNNKKKCNSASLYLDDLRFAYIVYGLSKDKRFAQALDELESRGDEVIRKMVGRVRAAIDFVDTVMHAISVGDSGGDVNDENMGVNDEAAQRVFSILRDAIKEKRGEADNATSFPLSTVLPVKITRLPNIVQCTDMREFTLTYPSIVRLMHHWAEGIKFVERMWARYDEMYIKYISNDQTTYWARIRLNSMLASTALLLIDLDKSYGTLKYINDVLMARIKRAKKALRVAEEIAAVARLLTM